MTKHRRALEQPNIKTLHMKKKNTTEIGKTNTGWGIATMIPEEAHKEEINNLKAEIKKLGNIMDNFQNQTQSKHLATATTERQPEKAKHSQLAQEKNMQTDKEEPFIQILSRENKRKRELSNAILTQKEESIDYKKRTAQTKQSKSPAQVTKTLGIKESSNTTVRSANEGSSKTKPPPINVLSQDPKDTVNAIKSTYNDGLKSAMRVMQNIGIKIGPNCYNYCQETDQNRIKLSDRSLSDAARRSRIEEEASRKEEDEFHVSMEDSTNSYNQRRP
ncbi:PREDICTED: uncharacterized protein LOC106748756 [Dinoponera quadriceps]|uniref:Uncharacterized protein LOC106748756 n=1 Tax=Dinoponera quadriceps TaxID=609295 RepID=A0A6P3XX17_DINQU|nr:PREDICTED: uncharacterized protein LOC106748756 [Dinoponera quadriceps]